MADIPETFADHPPSVGEIRAHRDGDGSVWTPRDALINLLRDIDAGIAKPDALVILYREQGDEPRSTCGRMACVVACPDRITALGLAASLINRGA